MEIYEKHIIVKKDDLDSLNHVNNVRYVQWVQDVAQDHWLSKVSEDILKRYYWVLVKHTINYKNQSVLGDTLSIKTYVESSEGVISVRKVEMYNRTTSKLIVISETKWCLMDTNTQKPARITESISKIFQ